MSTETETTSLVVTSPGQTVLQVFSTHNGLDPAIDKIEAEAKALKADISTQEGRDAIRSMAFKLARSKTALDKMGKDLTEDQRKQIDAVNAERKRGWERLEKLQHEIRKPLTDWEGAEEKRVADHEAEILRIEQMAIFMQDTPPTSAQVEERISLFNTRDLSRVWQEFDIRAAYTIKTTGDALMARLSESTKRETEAAELEHLRREDAERKQREHEARIAADAAEKARLEAERRAAEQAALERQRVEAERIAQNKETERREDDKEHRKKINNEVLADLMEACKRNMVDISEAQARTITTAIAKCEIRNVRIGY